ncbi:MAG: hypothetical protein ACYS67_12035 [Planctomycetota bacterium]|jgi:hypothetical protein
MERKKGKIKAGCVKILWTVMVLFLCAAPSVQASETVPGEEEWDIARYVGSLLYVYGTANLYPGFYADNGIYAYAGSTVNIHGGTIPYPYWISVFGSPYATVTVYGTDFQVTNGTIDPSGNWFTVNVPSQFVRLTGTYGEYQGAPGGPIDLSFSVADGVPIYLADPPVSGPDEITIDIKPGSYPNAINLGSNGVIPVAILSTEDLDATTIDPDTVSLGGSGVAVRGKGNKSLATQEDVNGDGLMDLVVKVETENLDPGTFQNGLAVLQVTVDGNVIYEGSDEIIIVPPE